MEITSAAEDIFLPRHASLLEALDWVKFADYDSGEKRDDSGRWTKSPGDGPGKDYDSHVATIKKTLADKIAAGQTSDVTETIDGAGKIYKPERQKQHDEIVNDLLKKTEGVPREGRAIISGGLGGAGKTTVLTKHAGIDQSKWLTVNPDDIKELMAKKGMIPKVPGLSPMEAAPLVHEESGYIAQQLAHRAQMEKRNMIWDITMSSTKSVDKRLRDLRSAGYDDIGGVFVDIPVETSVERALARHKRGEEAYKNGKGWGGRYVPPELIRKSKGFKKTKNKEVFDDLRPKFNEYGIWDNSGAAPKKVVGTGRWSTND
jgi:predicted ABC-type ATPase